MLDIIKKIHKRNPIINYFIVTTIIGSLFELLGWFMRINYFNIHLDPLGEIIATFTSLITYIIALYFIDIAFIQPNKSFFKWQTCIQFIVFLVCCYFIKAILLAIRKYLIYGDASLNFFF